MSFHLNPNFFQTEILTHEPNLIQIHIKNTSLAFLNSIRRVILEELPAYAPTKILIKSYNGLLPEEILAHRLGLIPIFLDPSENLEFCMKLTKKGPGKVTTNDIKVYDINGNQISSFKEINPNLKENFMIKPNVLITKQLAEDFLDIEMYASKSNAKDHAKHSFVTVCFYKILREIKLSKKFENQDAIFLQNLLGKDKILIENNEAILINNLVELEKIIDLEGIEILNDSDENVIFVIETEFLDPLDVFLRGIFLLMEKAKKLREEIKKYQEEE